jgi:maleylpyruvate isomerase
VSRTAAHESLAWIDEGSERFETAVRRLRDVDLRSPSALAGWTRAHVVAHVARNADALGNLLTWARTGVETPMYSSTEQREHDIEAGAVQPPDVLRQDLADAMHRFSNDAASLPAERWSAEVRTRRGRTIPASEVVWMRCREVWVHTVDLDVGASFADFPAAVVADFLDDVAADFTQRPISGGFELVDSDSSRTWPIGSRSARGVIVEGRAHELLAWLLGRSDGAALTSSARSLPTLPAWL